MPLPTFNEREHLVREFRQQTGATDQIARDVLNRKLLMIVTLQVMIFVPVGLSCFSEDVKVDTDCKLYGVVKIPMYW